MTDDDLELLPGDSYAEFDEEADPETWPLESSADEAADDEPTPDAGPRRPVVAVVGRPNVGKSSLVNRVLGSRAAVVEDVPGVTRDRVQYEAQWNGRDFTLVDTGGWDDRATGRAAAITEQAERAMTEADVVVLVVDAVVGATDVDDAVARVLRRAQVPVVLAANKCDDSRSELEASALWSLGLGEPHPVSALHGRGSGDLLDAVVAELPEVGTGRIAAPGLPRVALLGKPNVGKSSMLNRLAGAQRVVVDSIAGTTVDPVDEVIELGGRPWVFVDTAGVRRRVREASGHEYYASLRTRTAIERADVVALLVDASEPVTEQDTRLAGAVVEAGRGLVIVMNKWDLVDDERRRYLDREYERSFAPVWWAPRINASAQTGRGTGRLAVALDEAESAWRRRLSTGKLNVLLREIGEAHPHPIRGGRQPRILFGTQATVAPPTFVLFTTGFLEAGYRRFIERRLREAADFSGAPMRIELRIRAKRRR